VFHAKDAPDIWRCIYCQRAYAETPEGRAEREAKDREESERRRKENEAYSKAEAWRRRRRMCAHLCVLLGRLLLVTVVLVPVVLGYRHYAAQSARTLAQANFEDAWWAERGPDDVVGILESAGWASDSDVVVAFQKHRIDGETLFHGDRELLGEIGLFRRGDVERILRLKSRGPEKEWSAKNQAKETGLLEGVVADVANLVEETRAALPATFWGGLSGGSKEDGVAAGD
jgi:hypothetical protein